jgi:hypothetical protein
MNRWIVAASAAAIMALGGAGFGLSLAHLRHVEGKVLAARVKHATWTDFERWRVEDGMNPDSGFSIDDYCGAHCRPASILWDACVDSCLAADNRWSERE